jgi:hypothetical protein
VRAETSSTPVCKFSLVKFQGQGTLRLISIQRIVHALAKFEGADLQCSQFSFGNGAVPVKHLSAYDVGCKAAVLNICSSWSSCCRYRLRLRLPRVHASVRGQRMAANMMLVQCNSDVPISLACSIWIGISPDHGIIGTASLGDLEGLRSGRQRVCVRVVRLHEGSECQTGTRYHRPTSGAGSPRCGAPERPWRALHPGGGQPVLPMFATKLNARDAS